MNESINNNKKISHQKNNVNLVIKIIRKYISPAIADIYIFGSRSTKNFRIDSDLDILLYDYQIISPENVTKLIEELEESSLPFKVDIVIKSRITHEFFEKIKPTLILMK